LGVSQYKAIHPKLESQINPIENPKSQQALVWNKGPGMGSSSIDLRPIGVLFTGADAFGLMTHCPRRKMPVAARAIALKKVCA
jgi:hypothetical protein